MAEQNDATPVSEAGNLTGHEAAARYGERGKHRHANLLADFDQSKRMLLACIEDRETRENVAELLMLAEQHALAKPDSSPAGGDVVETLVPLKWRHVDVEQFEAHSIIGTYEVCGQLWSFVPTLKKAGAEMGSLDEARKAAQSHRDMYGPQPRRAALSQSTSAGRGDGDAS